MQSARLLFVILALCPWRPLHAQPCVDPARRAAFEFLAAMDSLRWEPFRQFFADDVTMFFPFLDAPARADGRAAVEARFRRFFRTARADWERSGRSDAPHFGIVPRDVLEQPASPVSVVSFRVGEDRAARWSLIFKCSPAEGWKLIHLHASAAPVLPAAAPRIGQSDDRRLRGGTSSGSRMAENGGKSALHPSMLPRSDILRVPSRAWRRVRVLPQSGR